MNSASFEIPDTEPIAVCIVKGVAAFTYYDIHFPNFINIAYYQYENRNISVLSYKYKKMFMKNIPDKYHSIFHFLWTTSFL